MYPCDQLWKFFLGYAEIDESKMDPPQTIKSNTGPPLPCRWKMMQQIKRKRGPIATTITPISNDGAASDTDSGYEYVANPMKKRHRSAVGKSTNVQRKQQNGNHGAAVYCKSQPNKLNNADQTNAPAVPDDCRTNDKLDSSLSYDPINDSPTSKKTQSISETFSIDHDQQQIRRSTYLRLQKEVLIMSGDREKTKDAERLEGRKHRQSCNDNLFKHRSSSKGLHSTSDDNILYNIMSQQEIPCSHKRDKYNDGYQKLIKETMEPKARTHEYQKLNKLTMEPRLPITEPRCSNVNHHTF